MVRMEESVFGSELRRLRGAAKLSLPVFAARTHYSKGYLSRVENGRARPNRRLAEICDDVLGADGALVAIISTEERDRSSSAARFSGLPPVPRRFVDRHTELEQVRATLLRGGGEVCALVGMAGAGKTAVAVRAAWSVESHFRDGCLFFDLRSYSPVSAPVSSADVLDSVLRTLGVPGAEIPVDLDGRANLYRHRLRNAQLLLIFDNVGSAQQLVPLLPGGPSCGVLVTSRSRMVALDDAVHISVGVLPMSDGVRLFRSICGDTLSLDEGVLMHVVERCGNLPLAMRIAAARMRDTPDEEHGEIVQRLADEAELIDLLDDGERSVMAAFRLSYGNLSNTLQSFFGLLSLLPGSDFDARAAAGLAGVTLRSATRMLSDLHDAHMIVRKAGRHYGFHDLVRLFAVDQALGDLPGEDRDAALGRLLDYSIFQAEACTEFIAPHRVRVPLVLEQLPAVATGFADRGSALAWIGRE